MPDESAIDLQHRVAAALDCIPSAETEERLLPHLRWLVRELISTVTPEDLLASELMTLAAILSPAHARVLGVPCGGRPMLRIVPSAQSPKGSKPAS